MHILGIHVKGSFSVEDLAMTIAMVAIKNEPHHETVVIVYRSDVERDRKGRKCLSASIAMSCDTRDTHHIVGCSP